MMRVESRISVYERGGVEQEKTGMDGDLVVVRSHWNRDEFVVLEMPGGGSVTVLRADLMRALQNAGNWR